MSRNVMVYLVCCDVQATITALLMLAFPDFLILLVAFSAGVVAALGQAAIPYYIGTLTSCTCPCKYEIS